MIRKSMLVATVALIAGVGGVALAQVQTLKPVAKPLPKFAALAPQALQTKLAQPALAAAIARGVPKPLTADERLRRFKAAASTLVSTAVISSVPPAQVTLTPNSPQSQGALIVGTTNIDYLSVTYTFSFLSFSSTITPPPGGVYYVSNGRNEGGFVGMRFPVVAGKIHVIDCTMDGVETFFSDRPNSLSGVTAPIEGGHALRAFTPTTTVAENWVLVQDGSMFYGCQITRMP